MRKDFWHDVSEGIHVSTQYDLADFVSPEATPTVSIYLPIHRTEREGRRDEWDRIEFKDLINEAKRTLSGSYDEKELKPLFEKLDDMLLHEDMPLWLNASAGMAILANNDDCYVINMAIAPKACVSVGDEYYLKPLIRNQQFLMHYKLLLLNSDFFALLDGDYSGVHYVEMPDDVKHYFAEIHPEFDGETTALDYYSLEDHHSPYTGHKSRNEVTQEETEKFFRYVDKVMNDTLVRDDPTPVILVTLPEHESEFRKICTFKSLLPQGIKKDARTLTGKELRDDAVAIMEGIQEKDLVEIVEKYEYQASKDTASDDPVKLALALTERKVGTLILAAGKAFPGTYDQAGGTVDADLSANPVDDKETDPASPDLANAFAIAALEQDAQIVVVDQEKMPTKSWVAALYRF